MCILKARFIPEHRVRTAGYRVIAFIDEGREEDKIINAECLDCAASMGGCKHIIAFIMWIHRESELPPPTEVKYYLKKSPLSAVGTTIKFIKGKDMAPSPTRSRETSNDPNNGFLAKVIQHGAANGSQAELIFQLTDQTKPLKELEITTLLFEFENLSNGNPDEFLSFVRSKLTQEACIAVAKATVDQSTSRCWYRLRFARITASILSEAASCKTDGTLVKVSIAFSYAN